MHRSAEMFKKNSAKGAHPLSKPSHTILAIKLVSIYLFSTFILFNPF